MSAARHWAIHLRLSHHGAAFIATEEGVRLHPYHDSEGWVTAGVGHLVTPMHKTITRADVERWTFRTARAAIDYFRNHDVLVYEHAVRVALGRASLTQAQYDMCVSLCFNIGTAGFARSHVARAIRAGHMREAGNAFLEWDNPRLLLPRRERERHRFLIGHW